MLFRSHLSIGGGIDLEPPFKQFFPWTKLQSLHFNEVFIMPNTLLPILRLAPNLSTLDLHQCGSDFLEEDDLHITGVTMPSLRYLHLHFSSYSVTSQILARNMHAPHLDQLKVSEVNAEGLQAMDVFLQSSSGACVTGFNIQLVPYWMDDDVEASLLPGLLSILHGLPALQRLHISLNK